ncbi:hypothetical protein L6164_002378 [Bauhinia variegata]|uniref:Uncharacterized protein n=1 Tax=Bauhinia variegata TaxID=167791 RepID=A0ACB9PY20_BAUVA|nr:hypothetical protein L6164_002378 [Bauhinia variegata]
MGNTVTIAFVTSKKQLGKSENTVFKLKYPVYWCSSDCWAMKVAPFDLNCAAPASSPEEPHLVVHLGLAPI